MLSWSRLTHARLLNRYEWIHLSMLLSTPFLISLTMSPSIHTLSNARCMSIQATRVTFFSWNASSVSCTWSDLQSHGTAESQLVLVPKGRWSPGTVPLNALVDNSLHSFPNTAGEAYGAVTGCLFWVVPFLEDWNHCCFPPFFVGVCLLPSCG